ncbi:MAG: hypothetical protein ACRDUA_17520 [Micromonosporaceae bacterium]
MPSTDPAPEPARPAKKRDIINMILVGTGGLLMLGTLFGAMLDNLDGTVSGWFVVTTALGLLLFVAGVAFDVGEQERETAQVMNRVRDAVGQHPAVPLADDESDSATAGHYQTSVPADNPPLPAGTSTPQERMIEQINAVVKAELRRLERRGLRMQWFFFAAGIPVGILINMFVK